MFVMQEAAGVKENLSSGCDRTSFHRTVQGHDRAIFDLLFVKEKIE
jgi:hypothetical protein